MITIFGKASSINVRKVLWTCTEIGLNFEQIDYGSGTINDVHSPDFLALNPNAMVPVLRDEFGTLWESNTICRYLANRYQRIDLLPIDPMERAQVEKWMDWQATELNNAWRYVFMARVRQHGEFQDAAKILASENSWNRHMQIIEAQLDRTNAFMTGDQLTLADIVTGVSINRWRATPMQHAVLPAVEAYFDRLCQREGFLTYGANGIP